MTPAELNSILVRRDKLLSKLQGFNNPAMFDTNNYNSHKLRAIKALHEIAETLYKELNIDKKKNAL